MSDLYFLSWIFVPIGESASKLISPGEFSFLPENQSIVEPCVLPLSFNARTATQYRSGTTADRHTCHHRIITGKHQLETGMKQLIPPKVGRPGYVGNILGNI